MVVALLCGGCNIVQFGGNVLSNEPVEDRTRELSELPIVKGHTDEILFITSLDPSKSLFVTGAKDGKVLFWSGSPLQARVLFDMHDSIDDASYHADTKRLAIAVHGAIHLFDLTTGKKFGVLDRLKSRVLDMAFSPDGESLVFGATDNRAYRWKFVEERNALTIADREKSFERYNGPSLPVGAVAVHPNGRLFFTGDWDGGLNGWLAYDSDRQGGYYDQNVFGPQFFSEGVNRIKFDRGASHETIQRIAVSSDGKLLLTAIGTGMIELWKVRGVKKGGQFKAHEGDVFSLAISPDGLRMVSAGRDGVVRIMKIHHDTDEELRAKDDRTFDYDLTVEKDIPLADVRAVTFRNNNVVIAGDRKGNIYEFYAVE